MTTSDQLKECKHIACCFTIYKLFTKVLTNRVKLVIGALVSPSQTTFIKGNSFIDNILFSHELFKWYTRKDFIPIHNMKADIKGL